MFEQHRPQHILVPTDFVSYKPQLLSLTAAMERADKNIDELLQVLHGKFYGLRQSGIDEELFDVIAGFESLTVH